MKRKEQPLATGLRGFVDRLHGRRSQPSRAHHLRTARKVLATSLQGLQPRRIFIGGAGAPSHGGVAEATELVDA
jgi:hypothetical protein